MTMDGSVTKRKQGVMDAFMDRGLSDEEKTQGERDTRIMGLEDVTAEELETEFDRLQLRSSDPQDMAPQQLPGGTPPTVRPYEV